MTTRTAELRPHARSNSAAIRRVGVSVETASWPRELGFRFFVEGDIGRLRLPAAGIARRRDGLWQHTCFEVFLKPDASESYHEFNFSPSTEWAAWRFGGRRSDRSLPDLPAPAVRFDHDPDRCELSALVPIAALPELAGAGAVRAGITAVIEAADGSLMHWALAHVGEAPDFHDPATFTMRVTPP